MTRESFYTDVYLPSVRGKLRKVCVDCRRRRWRWQLWRSPDTCLFYCRSTEECARLALERWTKTVSMSMAEFLAAVTGERLEP